MSEITAGTVAGRAWAAITAGVGGHPDDVNAVLHEADANGWALELAGMGIMLAGGLVQRVADAEGIEPEVVLAGIGAGLAMFGHGEPALIRVRPGGAR